MQTRMLLTAAVFFAYICLARTENLTSSESATASAIWTASPAQRLTTVRNSPAAVAANQTASRSVATASGFLTTTTTPAITSTTAYASSARTGMSNTNATSGARVSMAQPSASNATMQTRSVSATTATPAGPIPEKGWQRLVDPPAVFVESTSYNVTCVGTATVTLWSIGSSSTQRIASQIGPWLYSSSVTFVAYRAMNNVQLKCRGQNMSATENSSLTMTVLWGPSFSGVYPTLLIQPPYVATYVATCGRLSSNPPAQYAWLTASTNGSFNGSASVVTFAPSGGGGDYAAPAPVLFNVSRSANASTWVTCLARNPATGHTDSVRVVFRETQPGTLDYSTVQPRGYYAAGQSVAITCTVRSARVSTIGIRRSGHWSKEVVGCSERGPDADSPRRPWFRTQFTMSLRSADGSGADSDQPIACDDVPWNRSADFLSVTFTLLDVSPRHSGTYQCHALEAMPVFSEFVSPSLKVAVELETDRSYASSLYSGYFSLQVYDTPTVPVISAPRALVDGERQQLLCASAASYPVPTLRWSVISGSQSLSINQLAKSVVVSENQQPDSTIARLSFVANRQMEGTVLRCSIDWHPLGVSRFSQLTLAVVYGPALTDGNRSVRVLHRRLSDALWLPCRVDSKPRAVLWWYMKVRGSISTIPRGYYEQSQGVILEVPYSYREIGQVVYVCRAFNLETRQSADLEITVVWGSTRSKGWRKGAKPTAGDTTDAINDGHGRRSAGGRQMLLFIALPVTVLGVVLLAFVCATGCLLSKQGSKSTVFSLNPTHPGGSGRANFAAPAPPPYHPMGPGGPGFPGKPGAADSCGSHRLTADRTGPYEAEGRPRAEAGAIEPAAAPNAADALPLQLPLRHPHAHGGLHVADAETDRAKRRNEPTATNAKSAAAIRRSPATAERKHKSTKMGAKEIAAKERRKGGQKTAAQPQTNVGRTAETGKARERKRSKKREVTAAEDAGELRHEKTAENGQAMPKTTEGATQPETVTGRRPPDAAGQNGNETSKEVHGAHQARTPGEGRLDGKDDATEKKGRKRASGARRPKGTDQREEKTGEPEAADERRPNDAGQVEERAANEPVANRPPAAYGRAQAAAVNPSADAEARDAAATRVEGEAGRDKAEAAKLQDGKMEAEIDDQQAERAAEKSPSRKSRKLSRRATGNKRDAPIPATEGAAVPAQ